VRQPGDNHQTTRAPRYRPDIDGLRAVSVLAVVLFHAGLGVPGGFVGVDVFFVISGFLITQLIRAELAAGSFSMIGFWERRIRRIWPASVVMTAATLAAGWLVLMPEDLKNLGTDAVSQSLMASNIRFWRSADYFAAAAETRALLHTWSLAVEEQFYLVFPVLMLWMARFRTGAIVAALAVASIGSLAACQVELKTAPMAAFFLLPYRAWELSLGALLAITPERLLPHKRVRATLTWAGIGLIAVPCVVHSGSTTFPGLSALAPCIGAVLVMLGAPGEGASLVTRALSTAPMRFIGLMSYSLYLWHWPIIALTRYCLGVELSWQATTAVLAATGFVSYLSWRFVELPFRKGKGHTSPAWPAIVGGAMASLAVAMSGMIVRMGEGFPGRIDPVILRIGAPTEFRMDWALRAKPDLGDAGAAIPIGARADHQSPCFILWGDSHGMAISAAIDACGKHFGISGIASLRAGVPSVPGAWNPRQPDGISDVACQRVSEAMLDRIRQTRPRFVLLCSRWWQYVEDESSRMAPIGSASADQNVAEHVLCQGLLRIAAACQDAGTELVVFLEVPSQRGPPQQRAALARILGDEPSSNGVSKAEHDAAKGRINGIIGAALDGRATIVDLAAPFFGGDGISAVGGPDTTWYWDDDHINDLGAELVVRPWIEPLFRRMAQECASAGR
jgi:peptidoglycan/LPS O-acetylase OafA/YrhL